MHSGKSMHVIAVAKNYEIQKKTCFIVKINPDGNTCEVTSRTGLQTSSVISLEELKRVLMLSVKISCVIVDEAQFLTKSQVDDLRTITLKGIPVICYGLRTNWMGELFEGSKRLLEISDSIEEMKTTCWYCERKATMNYKISQKGNCIEVEHPGEHKYVPTCYECFISIRSTDD